MGYLKNELSDRSKWHISKHRYLELVHFCLQYPEWKQKLKDMVLLKQADIYRQSAGAAEWNNRTEQFGVVRAELLEKIELVERIAREADPGLASYILYSVTRGMTYPQMAARESLPCGKDMFYDRRRKFFWLLSFER